MAYVIRLVATRPVAFLPALGISSTVPMGASSTSGELVGLMVIGEGAVLSRKSMTERKKEDRERTDRLLKYRVRPYDEREPD